MVLPAKRALQKPSSVVDGQLAAQWHEAQSTIPTRRQPILCGAVLGFEKTFLDGVPSIAILMAEEWGLYSHSKGITMAAPQLSVRSSKARDLAHRLARRENRSIAEVVERALEAYEVREAGREPASSFYSRLNAQFGSDIDLEVILRENRHPHKGVEL